MNLKDEDFRRAAALQQEKAEKEARDKDSEAKFWLTLATLPDIGEDAFKDFLSAGVKYCKS